MFVGGRESCGCEMDRTKCFQLHFTYVTCFCVVAITTAAATTFTVTQTPVNPALSTGAIVGIAVGGVVLLVIIIVIIAVLVCKCSGKNKVGSEPELGRQSRGRQQQEEEMPLQKR